MNAQERLRVARLVSRLAAQPDMPKDEDAALELDALMKVRPDAPYLLMQRALMLELMLEQAQLELEQLRQARQAGAGGPARAPASGPGFAERMLRRMRGPGLHAAAGGMSGGYGMAPGMMHGMGAAGGGGFLRNAAAVGAGVLGGSLLFQGLENLFDGDDGLHQHYGEQNLADMNDAGFAGNEGLDEGFLNDAGYDAGEGLDYDAGGSDWT